MPSRSPPLGSQALQTPPSPQLIHVTATTCHNLSLFKDFMKEHRKLDDTVTMRLNRNMAQFRDRQRVGGSGGGGGGGGAAGAGAGGAMQNEACAYFWSQLVAGWKARTEIVHYCVDVVDRGMEQKRAEFERGADDDDDDEQTRRRRRDAALYAEEVKRNQIHNELTVERIVRLRSLEAFRTHCKYFEPPRTDGEARKWWDG